MRGAYLVEYVLGCLHCHSERNWDVLGAPPVNPLGAGRNCDIREGMPGVAGQGRLPDGLCFPNITADEETGIGTWSDKDIIRAMREGQRPDGAALFPIMPWLIYRDLADSDAAAVAEYVQGLKPVNYPQPQRKQVLKNSYRDAMAVGGEPAPPAPPPSDDELATGRYLAQVARCGFCHTPRDSTGSPRPEKAWTGGALFDNGYVQLRSSNLTPHPDGLGNTTRQDFINLVRQRGNGQAVDPAGNTVMPWVAYAGMTDADLGAIWAYLQTLPPASDTPGR